MWTIIFDILGILMLAAICFAGLFLTVAQLPGTWLIAVSAAVYAWIAGPDQLGWTAVLVIFAIAGIGEIVEFASGAVVARRGGASRRAAWYGLAGGLIGAFALTIPVPLIGTIIGAMLGCFAGAFIAEMQEGRRFEEGVRSGAFSAAGRALGSIAKIMAAAAMSAITLVLPTVSLFR